MKKVYTSGDVAKICKVAPRTASKWFDSGRLKGYRIPGSQDRRIPRSELLRFLKEYGMPLGDAEGDRVLVVGAPPALAEAFVTALDAGDELAIRIAADGFTAGSLAADVPPVVVVIDLGMGRTEALAIARQLRADPRHEYAQLVALAPEDEGDPTVLVEAHGFAVVLVRPFDPALLAERVKELVGRKNPRGVPARLRNGHAKKAAATGAAPPG